MNTLDGYHLEIAKNVCSFCNYSGLQDLPIKHYDHEGGWLVKGYRERQWLYVECPRCGYEWALWKLGVRR